MPTALDTFRAQREAADGVYARLTEVSQLLHQLRGQADALARNDELHAVLQREQSWLDQAQRTIEEARRWRELEMNRFSVMMPRLSSRKAPGYGTPAASSRH